LVRIRALDEDQVELNRFSHRKLIVRIYTWAVQL